MAQNDTGNRHPEGMAMPTELKNVLTWSEKIEQYDKIAKNLLARKSILAHILAETVEDFKDMSPKELENLIEGDIYVRTVPMEPGRTNADFSDGFEAKNPSVKSEAGPDRLREFNTEQSDKNEGTIYFDILFYVRMPDGISRIIVNVEPQRETPSEYGLFNRAVFGAARLVSSQKEREFTGENFDDICRTWSIWIRFNAREASWNYITLNNRAIVGNYQWKGKLDLINIHLLRIPNRVPKKDAQNELLRFLSTIFSTRLSAKEKISSLEKDFDMKSEVTQYRKEMDHMGSLGLGIYEEGVEDGFHLGDESKAKKVALRMHKRGDDIPYIADTLEESEEQIEEWLGLQPA